MSSPSALHQVMRHQNGLCLALARCQRFEVELMVWAHHNRLSIDHGVIDGQRREAIANAGEGVSRLSSTPKPNVIAVLAAITR
jgi:hypothetical protein